ncbi:MAG: hypothetical protein NZ483_04590 [Verrucomicrobiae bacterium]|nr:hypothetical protein [Verrucomicrobiae bacterium]MDW8344822.1 hypothetical protein [Verrucomicrobiae bacterium]
MRSKVPEYAVGELVIYRKAKASPHPGPRATDIRPSEQGEDYLYEVDKFWRVVDLPDPEHVTCVTRTGKLHVILRDDPCLRKASWWERWRYRERFPKPELLAAVGVSHH